MREILTGFILVLLLGTRVAGAEVKFPHWNFAPGELFQVVGRIDKRLGAPRGHGSVTLINGYLAVIYSADSGRGNGGFAFYDISHPQQPRLVHRENSAATQEIREAHGYGIMRDRSGKIRVALQTTAGIQIWDWTDVRSPQMLSRLELPGVERSDYAKGAWWVFWQAPIIYVGGSGNGLYIVDASDPQKPFLAARDGSNPIPPQELGGFRVGPTFALGNLMVLTSMDDNGYTTLDIGDPLNPEVLFTAREGMPKVYSAIINGTSIIGAGSDHHLHVHDISDPKSIRAMGKLPIDGKGGYLSFQDGFAHVGASSHYAKIDVRNPSVLRQVGRASSNVRNRDEDFATVLGNLVVVSDDHGNGSFLVPHQSDPDRKPPEVNGVQPQDRSVSAPLSSRLGLSFTDAVEPASLHDESIVVRSLNGQKLSGQYSVQGNIVNFAPDQPLRADTTYEVLVSRGGVQDLVGNALEQNFRSVFTTGKQIEKRPRCTLKLPPPQTLSSRVEISVEGVLPAAEIVWDLGDGTVLDRLRPSAARVTHLYSRPGHFSVVARVSKGAESYSCTGQVTVHEKILPQPAIQATSIAVSSAISSVREIEPVVFVVNSDHDSVARLSGQTKTVDFIVPVGRNPQTVALSPMGSGEVWVANEGDATISVLQASSGKLKQTVSLPLGSRPYGVVLSRDGWAYVTLQATGQLLKIDAQTKAVVATVTLGATARGLTLDSLGERLFVSRFISPDHRGEVWEVSTRSLTLLRTHALAFDKSKDQEDQGRGLPNYLGTPALSPSGKQLWIPSKKDNMARGLVRDGQPLTFENSVRAIVSKINLVLGAEELSARIDLNDRSMPVAITHSPRGDYIFIALEGSNSVDVYDAYSGSLVTALDNGGYAPKGLSFDGPSNRLYVHYALSRTVSVYDLGGLLEEGTQQVHASEPIKTADHEVLPPLVLRGKQLFHNAKDPRLSRDGYISCASCHADGGHDGRTWDFTDRGEGLRNTISLLGRGGVGHGNVHWTGNFDEIQDFEHDIRNAFGGQGLLPDAEFHRQDRDRPLGGKKAGLSRDLDALAAYVASLTSMGSSPYRQSSGELTVAAHRGKRIFERLDCRSCHAGSQLTDSRLGLLHDVGTVKLWSGKRLGGPLVGLDTPTLKGLWDSAPHLHDGSARDLNDLIQKSHAGNGHEKLVGLSDADRRDLIEYLLQIDDAESMGMPLAKRNGKGWVESIQLGGSLGSARVARLYFGQSVYSDREYYFTEIPSFLIGAELIQMANDDKFNKSDAFISIDLGAPAEVYIAFDERAFTRPRWLNGWDQVDDVIIGTSDTPRTLWKKTFPAGGRVTLGGNAQFPMWGAESQYSVFVRAL